MTDTRNSNWRAFLSLEKGEMEHLGWTKLKKVLSATDVELLSRLFEDVPANRAGRRLTGQSLVTFLEDAALAPALRLLQALVERPVVVRAVAFQKSENANWFVPPHQDRCVPLSSASCPPGFNRLTRKPGGWQAEAPESALRKMVNLRIFIDPATELDGPLQVLPGSHKRGRLTQAEIASICDQTVWKSLTGAPGDIVALSPLLIHRSRRAVQPTGRRVLQIEALPAEIVLAHDLIGHEIAGGPTA